MYKVVRKNWPLEQDEYRIYCGRPTALGNPFQMFNESQRDLVCDKYKVWFSEEIKKPGPALDMLIYIRSVHSRVSAAGKYVGLECYCAPKRCHCDTIADFLNAELP